MIYSCTCTCRCTNIVIEFKKCGEISNYKLDGVKRKGDKMLLHHTIPFPFYTFVI